jgi:hypothetical protein
MLQRLQRNNLTTRKYASPDKFASVHDNRLKNFVVARWIGNEEPVFAKLIVDSEFVSLEVEVDPNLGNVIREILGYGHSFKRFEVIAKLIPPLKIFRNFGK